MTFSRIERAMEAAGFTMHDVQRLEVEAQLLREADPFYLEDYPIKEDKKIIPTCPPSPSTLRRLAAEMQEMFDNNGKENYQYSSPVSTTESFPDKAKEENGHDVSQGSTDSPYHSPLRKKIKIHQGTLSPAPEKCNGGGGENGSLASTSGTQDFFPPKHLLECLLREAQTLGET